MANLRPGLMALAVAALFLAGCGGDDDEGSGPPPSTESLGEPADTSTTQPDASTAADVRPFVEDDLAAWDDAMTAILADPQAVVDDPDHRLRGELAEPFTADSPYVEDFDALLDGYVAQDVGIRPGPNGLAQQTTLLHFTEAPDPDHVSFVFCTFNDGVGYSLASGDERPPSIGVTQGTGEATRVDGAWRLHRLQQLGTETHPPGTPNPCPDLVEPDGAG